jgi:hypothetical protein
MADRLANLEKAVSYLSERVLGEQFSVPDLADLQSGEPEDRVAVLTQRVAAIERRRIEDEKHMQIVIQAMDEILRRVQTVEGALIEIGSAAQHHLKRAG